MTLKNLFVRKSKLEILFSDIFIQDVDVIVNPANSYMVHGGGLAGMIARRGGHAVVEQSRRKAPIPTGSSIITTAGKLRQKAVVHAVGPIWDESESPELLDRQLANAYKSALALAASHGHSSVAFPAVSCGVFSFPVERAAPIAVKALSEALKRHKGIKRVVICLAQQDHYEAFKAAQGT